ncbi:MAG: NAD(P)/FAD-dependent oxidoreductase [Syntrophales bacterium]
MPETFDIIVIGSGPGGHAAAQASAGLGARTAIIEKKDWGGTCTNTGCVPTKALLACSRTYASLKKMRRLGVYAADFRFDFIAMRRHQMQVVRTSSLGVRKSLADAGVLCVQGEGRILSPGEVEVLSNDGKKILNTRRIVIAWGSRPDTPTGITLSGRIMSSDGLLAMENPPGSTVIVGGGAIGLEFATFLADLGSKVFVIELMDQILPCEDRESADFIAKELEKSGIEIFTSARMMSLSEENHGIRMRVSRGDKDIELTADCAAICTGRKPALRAEELDRLGINYSNRGIWVNGSQMTNIENIFALGDVTGGILLAHRAAMQGKTLASLLFGDGSVLYNEDAVPCVLYTHPGLARVGLTEKQAVERRLDYEVKRSGFGANIMARAELAGGGFAKLLFCKGRLVGAAVAGEGACELIAPMSLAVSRGMGYTDFRNWIIAHPTLSEVLNP